MNDLDRIVEALSRCDSVLVSVHRNPDGDALGSQLALARVLGQMGKRVTMHNLDKVPDMYRFLPGAEQITFGKFSGGDPDGFIVLDCDPPRTGLFNDTYPGRVQINIDHHVTNPREWPLTWLLPEATATGEMVYRLIERLKVPIDRETALCLYAAIFTDTGSFRYTNTTPESMRIAAAMIEAGADPWTVAMNVYESIAFPRIKLLGHVLNTLERSPDGLMAWVVVTEELYRQTGTSAEDTDSFVNYARSVQGVEVGILFRQTAPEQFKISLRSKGRIDLSGVAQALGGGGHRNAAGGVIDGPFPAVRDKVLSAVQQQIRLQLGPRAAAS